MAQSLQERLERELGSLVYAAHALSAQVDAANEYIKTLHDEIAALKIQPAPPVEVPHGP